MRRRAAFTAASLIGFFGSWPSHQEALIRRAISASGGNLTLAPRQLHIAEVHAVRRLT